MKKILYGICGIGNGHLFRQLPIIENLLLNGQQIMVFAYGASLEYFQKNPHPNLKAVPVCVPYYIGQTTGLDFVRSAELNKNMDWSINLEAFAEAQRWLGKPDLVISDYEPYCFQYGYSFCCPLITVDQQSKFLPGSCPQPLEGSYYQDEVARLRMFFPYATERIACSFFKVEDNGITLVPPILRLGNLINQPVAGNYLVYLTAQSGYQQELAELLTVLGKRSENYNIFINSVSYNKYLESNSSSIVLPSNVNLYPHGHLAFDSLMASCEGLISTAGHTLLSEAMHLGIPVYALPLPLYEQKLNAHTISANGFGISNNSINCETLEYFIRNNSVWRENISRDTNVLLHGDGLAHTLKIINRYLK